MYTSLPGLKQTVVYEPFRLSKLVFIGLLECPELSGLKKTFVFQSSLDCIYPSTNEIIKFIFNTFLWRKEPERGERLRPCVLSGVFKTEPVTEKVLSWLALQAPALISCVPLSHCEPSLMIHLPFWGPGSNKAISKAACSRPW